MYSLLAKATRLRSTRGPACEPSALTTELLTLAVGAVKRRCDRATRSKPGRLVQRKCRWNQLCATALITKGRVDGKACKKPSPTGMRLYVKIESDARRNVSVMPGQTDRQTRPHILDSQQPQEKRQSRKHSYTGFEVDSQQTIIPTRPASQQKDPCSAYEVQKCSKLKTHKADVPRP